MFETAIGKLVFLATASVFAAFGLLWYSRRVRADDELQRRLGHVDSHHLRPEIGRRQLHVGQDSSGTGSPGR